MRDLIASNAPLRGGSHKARQNGPKHYPRGFKGIAIPLARLSPLSFAVQRKMESPKGVGLAARQENRKIPRASHPFNPSLATPPLLSIIYSLFSIIFIPPPHPNRKTNY